MIADDLSEAESTQEMIRGAPRTNIRALSSTDESRKGLHHGVAWRRYRQSSKSDTVGGTRGARRALANKMHWGESISVVALTAALALVVGRLWPHQPPTSPAVALRAIESKGQILCDRDDGRHFASCNPERENGIVGLRTLDQSGVTVETASGVVLILESSSTLRMTDIGAAQFNSRVALTEGTMNVRVPKAVPSEAFSVLTPHATITARGTAFSVEVSKTESVPLHTCVRLREGILDIASNGRNDRIVSPAAWGCINSTKIADAQPDGGVSVPADPLFGDDLNPAQSASRRQSKSAGLDQSSIAVQARLLDRALRSERRHDLFSAEKTLRKLLALFPNSIVAPEARAGLERIAAKRSGHFPRQARTALAAR